MQRLTKRASKRSGFTIVELLIVIVVIGILAAITIVAYAGIQTRGRDAKRSSDVNLLAKAITLYRVDNSTYPSGGGCAVNTPCNPTDLTAALVPKYVSSIPTDPLSPGRIYQYYRFDDATDSYVLIITMEARAACKVGAGSGVSTVWTSLTAC